MNAAAVQILKVWDIITRKGTDPNPKLINVFLVVWLIINLLVIGTSPFAILVISTIIN